MQLEINCLRKRLRRKRRRRSPLDSDPSSDDNGDGSYKPRSRTSPSESFRMMRTIIISEVRVHLAKLWEMML